jgi:hypothetical protein
VSTQLIPQRACGAMQPLAHVPPAGALLHTGVAPLQEVPQAPQLVAALRSVSQPLECVPSQFANAALHMRIWHVPVSHVAAAFASAQDVPQPPQSVSVVVGRSQPLLGSPSQSAKPAVHVAAQRPRAQVAPVVFAPIGQRFPHEPQFAVSVLVSTQRPLQLVPPSQDGPASIASIAGASVVAPSSVAAPSSASIEAPSSASRPASTSASVRESAASIAPPSARASAAAASSSIGARNGPRQPALVAASASHARALADGAQTSPRAAGRRVSCRVIAILRCRSRRPPAVGAANATRAGAALGLATSIQSSPPTAAALPIATPAIPTPNIVLARSYAARPALAVSCVQRGVHSWSYSVVAAAPRPKSTAPPTAIAPPVAIVATAPRLIALGRSTAEPLASGTSAALGASLAPPLRGCALLCETVGVPAVLSGATVVLPELV